MLWNYVVQQGQSLFVGILIKFWDNEARDPEIVSFDCTDCYFKVKGLMYIVFEFLFLKMENALFEHLGSNRQKLISTDRGGNDLLI